MPGVREAHNVTIFQLGGTTEVSLHLKLPPEMPLADGHRVAEQVEQAIRAAAPQVDAVQTHLEPLDPEVQARPLPDAEQARLAAQVLPIVTRLAGAQPRQLRFVDGGQGTVGFVTLGLDGGNTVSDAHRLASEIEQEIHAQIPEIHELVIHTEP